MVSGQHLDEAHKWCSKANVNGAKPTLKVNAPRSNLPRT